jgi:2-phosphosulfolactate phosphatase
VIAALAGNQSPEAEWTLAAFERFHQDLSRTLRESGSGQELMERGFGADVELAAQLNVSSTVPRLIDRAFVAIKPG